MERSGGGGAERALVEPAMSLLELARILDEAARLIRGHAALEAQRRADAAAASPVRITPGLVRRLIALRQLRTDHLGIPPGDVGWSIMLEVLLARLEGRRISQTALGEAAGVPHSTASRVTRTLAEAGILAREQDPEDERRVWVSLADSAAERMYDYLREALAEAPLIL